MRCVHLRQCVTYVSLIFVRLALILVPRNALSVYRARIIRRVLILRPTAKKPYNQEEVISSYKRLILRLPRPNQYLLLYVLDLLSVFARKCDKNLMTATSASLLPHAAAPLLLTARRLAQTLPSSSVRA